jgi:hypothetical protein
MPLPNDLVPVGVAFQRVTGRRPNAATIYRWSTRGSNGVVLRTWDVEGQLMTEIEAVEYFLRRKAKKRHPGLSLSPAKPPRKPRLNYDKVIKQLFKDFMSEIHGTRK